MGIRREQADEAREVRALTRVELSRLLGHLPEQWRPAWLGHADAGFTLRTYIHLMEEGFGDAAFMDEAVNGGKGWATGDPETTASRQSVAVAG